MLPSSWMVVFSAKETTEIREQLYVLVSPATKIVGVFELHPPLTTIHRQGQESHWLSFRKAMTLRKEQREENPDEMRKEAVRSKISMSGFNWWPRPSRSP